MDWLAFVNTVEPRVGPVRRDALADYPALVGWAVRAGLISGRTATALRGNGAAAPTRAAAALRAALRLREALFPLFLALAQGRRPPPEAVAVLHRHFLAACRAASWDVTPAGTRWRWADDDLDVITHRLAVDAHAALDSPGLARLRQCPPADGGCGWLFVDRTRNGSRRWCSMADCGGTVKARRQAAKRKAARAGRDLR